MPCEAAPQRVPTARHGNSLSGRRILKFLLVGFALPSDGSVGVALAADGGRAGRGRRCRVSIDELGQHATAADCWIAVCCCNHTVDLNSENVRNFHAMCPAHANHFC